MSDVQRLLREEEEEGWQALGRCFERTAPDRFEQPTLTEEGWSPKDAMFHVAGWMDGCGMQLERMRDGSFEPVDETPAAIERQNQEWFDVSRTMSPADVRSRFVASRSRMIEAFGTLGRVTPEAVEWFEESGALHYAKHAEDLRAFLGDGEP